MSDKLFTIGYGAHFSMCGTYRYRLDRKFSSPGPVVSVCMVNPSTADHRTDDQTIRKLIGFSKQFGFGRLIVVNLCAFRATDIRELKTAVDPIGPDNDVHIEEAFKESAVHIVAWGSKNKLPAKLRTRWKAVVAIAEKFNYSLKCLGTTRDGDPLHPLTISYDRELVDWQPR
jgi:hypothetical protein